MSSPSTPDDSAPQYLLHLPQIQRFLPHRTPFLLVDRILEIHPVGDISQPPPVAEVGTRVVGLKNVTFNEPFFQGHFPNYPIMPGVLILEAMAQVASFSVYPNMIHDLDYIKRDFQCILVGIDEARFRRQVIPGDTLRIETEVTRQRGKLWGFHCSASVDGQKVAEVDLLANLMATSKQSNS